MKSILSKVLQKKVKCEGKQWQLDDKKHYYLDEYLLLDITSVTFVTLIGLVQDLLDSVLLIQFRNFNVTIYVIWRFTYSCKRRYM